MRPPNEAPDEEGAVPMYPDFVCGSCGWQDFFFTDDTGERACVECGVIENSDTGLNTSESDSGAVTATEGAAGRLRPVVTSALTTKDRHMTPATLADEKFFANVLFYGKPKSGKTTAAATVAKLGKTTYIDAEAGIKAPALLQFDIPTANIEPMRDITYEALDALFWKLNEDPPVALVWDSISESHKKLLALTGERRVQRAKSKGETVWEEQALEIGDYGINTNEMRKLSRQFRDLQCHTAFVALEKRTQDDKTGVVMYGPDLTDKLASDILGYVDVICNTYTKEISGQEEPEYWGAFREFDLHAGGDRFKALPPRLINPSMERIIAYLTHEMDLESDPEMQAVFARANGDRSEIAEPDAEALLKNAGLKPTAADVGAPTPTKPSRERPARPPRPVVKK